MGGADGMWGILHWRVGREQVGSDPLDPVTGREQE